MFRKYNPLYTTYYSEISRIPLLTKEEEQDLAKKLAEANGEHEQYRNKFIVSNLRLVVDIAKKYKRWGLEFMDLIQEGNLGLIKAAEKFDYKFNVRFNTYATRWIKAYILKYIKDKVRTIHIPMNLFDEMIKIKYFKEQLQQELERKPTTEELAEKLDLSVTHVDTVLSLLKQPVSIFESYGDEEIYEFIDEKTKTSEEIVEKAQLKAKIREACGFLNNKEREIIFLKQLNDEKKFTLRELGKIYKLSRERIRQIQEKAIKKLQWPERKKSLEDFCDQ